MGLLDNTTQQQYYQGDDHGNYQFTSLNDIITQFMIGYVGEDKTISKAKRTDVAFYAQRAMQELSFDTFKSIKSQEIALPPSLTVILPHDYVNYTKISWSDSAGIKHRLYPTTCKTSNPFKIQQDDDGGYDFTTPVAAILKNSDFSDPNITTGDWSNSGHSGTPTVEEIDVQDGALTFTHGSKELPSNSGAISSRAYSVWQAIDVTDMDYIDIKATGLSAAAESGVKDAGILRFGITSSITNPGGTPWDPNITSPNAITGNPPVTNPHSRNHKTDIFDLQTTSGSPSYIEFNDGAGTASTEELIGVDVTNFTSVYVVITSYIENYTVAWTTANNNESENTIDDISIIYDELVDDLQTTGDSTTWTNYKSGTPSENQDDYQDDTYWPAGGERYGLDPQHAQVNGSFFIDPRLGKIHFSSNISGKTVVLDYISDGLGTDEEMQVHKFAEEAMYKWIAYGILSTRANTPEYIINRYKKEKFAETRKAKLRLSNIKLEEITQIFRGKSKHIKH